MTGSRQSWEARAKDYGGDLRGVLFRGLPEQLNAAIDAWHSWVVECIFLPRIENGGTLLDLGCGYGRLTNVVNRTREDISIYGQDFVIEYCRLFKKGGNACVQGDASHPPFLNGSFDGILAVTSLMYLPRNDIPRLLADLRKLLRPGGFLLAIDPSSELQGLIGLKRNMESPTRGQGFSRKQYRDLISNAGYAILEQGGNVRFSVASMLQQLLHSKKMERFAANAAGNDFKSDGYSRFALHRWILARSGCKPMGRSK